VTRRVTRVATVPLEGNSYSVDPALVGRRVELRYDPENLAVIEVFLDGRPAGAAVPFVIGRHVHRAVAPAPPPAAEANGVNYLGMVAAAHDEQADAGAAIDFTQLPVQSGADDQEEDGDG
jgi:putative transposase